jgi:hypothetical protein
LYGELIPHFIKLGYFKDLLVVMHLTVTYSELTNNTLLNNDIELEIISNQLKLDAEKLDLLTSKASSSSSSNAAIAHASISLMAKYAPGENHHFDKAPFLFAKKIASRMECDMKQYRQLLTKLRSNLNLIETYMATQQFELINFSHLPAVAAKKYRKALSRVANSEGKETPE